MWSTQRIYGRANESTIARCSAAGIVFNVLEPPHVPGNLLALAAVAQDLREFQEWLARSPTLLEPSSLRERLPENAGVEIDLAPSRDELLQAKWIAETIDDSVALYSAETFGGRCEYEFAWEFGPRERVLAYGARIVRTEQTSKKMWFFKPEVTTRTFWEGAIYELSSDGCVCHPWELKVGGVVRYLLPSFGIESPDGYFKPHLRGGGG